MHQDTRDRDIDRSEGYNFAIIEVCNVFTGKRPFVKVKCLGHDIKVMVDSGSTVILIDEHMWDKFTVKPNI